MAKILPIIFILLYEYTYSTHSTPNNFKKNNNRKLKEEEEINEDDIIILHTNDVHCGLNESIGYDGLMLYKKELLKKYKYVLTVDSGDHIQGGAIGLLSKGMEIINLMNKIGYNVSVLGNHEFDYGLNTLKECNQTLNCGYICSNFCYRENKTSIFAPYKLIPVGNKTIGFIGVTTPQTISKSLLLNIVDEKGRMIYDFLTGNNGQEYFDAVQNYINEVKKLGADYIIILAHLGNWGDALEQYTSVGLLSHISGVDALLDGHSHKIYSTYTEDKTGKEVPIIQTGTKLNNIGLIKIKSDGTVSSELISEVPEPDEKEGAEKIFRNDKERWVDSEMKEIIDDIINSYSSELDEVIGYTDFDLKINIDKSSDSSKQLSRYEENTLCDLVTDAIRNIGKGEISLINAGSIRTDLFKGNITFNKLINILPFSSLIIIKEVLGQDISDALEFGMRSLPNKSSRFLQVSGISFKVDENIKSSVILDENEMFMKVDGERRVYDVKVGNENLDLNKKYRMSLDKYIADGGDGYSMFRKYDEILNMNMTDNQALAIYIKEVLNGIIPDEYREKQGRILKISKNNDKDEKSYYIIIIVVAVIIVLIITILILIICFIKKKKTQEMPSPHMEMPNLDKDED